jgi:exosortase A-associated hydrolase 2
MSREVFFLQSASGPRFAIASRPHTSPIGGLLYLHPFAEEMNRSRRMAALAAQAFARQGWLVLQPDLAGCGDSAGDFGDAGWQDWLEDVSSAWGWLRANCEGVPLVLWTLRAGSLLAADWLGRTGESPALLLWQPVLQGQQTLTQFLRLKAASQMLDEAGSRTVIKGLRADLEAGRAVEIAGYSLSPELARGLGEAKLRLPQAYSAPVAAFEIASAERSEPSPGLAALMKTWREAGVSANVETVHGAGFWQTQEIETVPALIERSALALKRF